MMFNIVVTLGVLTIMLGILKTIGSKMLKMKEIIEIEMPELTNQVDSLGVHVDNLNSQNILLAKEVNDLEHSKQDMFEVASKCINLVEEISLVVSQSIDILDEGIKEPIKLEESLILEKVLMLLKSELDKKDATIAMLQKEIEQKRFEQRLKQKQSLGMEM